MTTEYLVEGQVQQAQENEKNESGMVATDYVAPEQNVQNVNAVSYTHLTVYENVALMKDIKDDILNPITILERVGLKNHVKKFPNQLSGGEQQRVSIARAITKNPEILLCDEPTGALDSETGCKVLQLIQDVCREFQKTVIIVTHNSNIAKVADKVIRLKNGKILEISLNDSPADIKEVEW